MRNEYLNTVIHLLLSFCSWSFRSFDKGQVWVAMSLKCSPSVLQFLLHPLSLCGHILSLMVSGSDDTQLVLQWLMRFEMQVLICVCRCSVHLNVEASVLFSAHQKVWEGQTSFHMKVMLLSTAFICYLKASTSLALIVTQVLSTYLNQWLGTVPMKVIKARNLFQVEGWPLLGTPVRVWHASVLRNRHYTGSRCSSEVKSGTNVISGEVGSAGQKAVL